LDASLTFLFGAQRRTTENARHDMDMKRTDLERLQQTLAGATDAITVARVYGAPIERDGALVIPAAAVRGGGGGGGGVGPDDQGSGTGGGFGVDARPVGAFVVRDGDVQWVPAVDRGRQAAVAGLVAVVGILALRSVLRSHGHHRRRR
jgi:uncharacterized spore protein YtfJ